MFTYERMYFPVFRFHPLRMLSELRVTRRLLDSSSLVAKISGSQFLFPAIFTLILFRCSRGKTINW